MNTRLSGLSARSRTSRRDETRRAEELDAQDAFSAVQYKDDCVLRDLEIAHLRAGERAAWP